ncbi:DUF2207 domain-containing protein [Cellulomonas timonensis]|uniref:DUF2207 domain-containing protein n=1 Tax=Cellulomonas timonensis TaxID=1689271 RepID=UPI0011C9A1C7|nr:DUF2207 domain-containing protein [Cellulomonas timonensis]
MGPWASRASAETTSRQILRYDAQVTVAADGTMRVELDFDFAFGDEPGHGPYLSWPTRMDAGENRDRVYTIDDVTASSPSGAPADVNLDERADALVVRVGDPDVGDIDGVHTYRIGYTVSGMPNPDVTDAATGAQVDELNWNAIGADWEIPLAHVSVTVTGPAEILQAACYAGPAGSEASCDGADVAADAATFTQAAVPVGDQLTVAVGWPVGTLVDTAPVFEVRPEPVDVLTPTPLTGSLALLVGVGGIGLATHRVRTRGRDRAYLGLTPGLMPVDGAEPAVGFRDRRAPVAVQFAPPAGVRPGELGTLLDEIAHPKDVTATLIDLAVRGYLRIEEVPRSKPGKKPKDWTLVRLRGAEGLIDFERSLYDGLFTGRSEVTLSELKTTFAATMASVQSGLYEEVIARGWFRTSPAVVRMHWRWAGLGLIALAGALGVAALMFEVSGAFLPPVALGLVGVAVLLMANAAPARTADGTAVLAEARGFQQYLATAEAEQLRFEEGVDVFSRYLPYAIVFGLTERWAQVFGTLAAQGAAVAEPEWYVGSYGHTGAFWVSYAAFGSNLERFSAVATTSLSATPGSSGDSGFSGGRPARGGGGGEGGGGGGGGGW